MFGSNNARKSARHAHFMLTVILTMELWGWPEAQMEERKWKRRSHTVRARMALITALTRNQIRTAMNAASPQHGLVPRPMAHSLVSVTVAAIAATKPRATSNGERLTHRRRRKGTSVPIFLLTIDAMEEVCMLRDMQFVRNGINE